MPLSCPETMIGKPLEKSGLPLRKICFVCTGNTCRSPMASGIFNQKYASYGVSVSRGLSAGGQPISDNALAVLHEHGITELDGYLSQRVTDGIMADSDEIWTMSSFHAQALLFAYPQYASKIRPLPLEIPDPYGGPVSLYRTTYDRLEEAIDEMMKGQKK
ncbi:MAG: hypothetical protein II797_02875 [Clostridia bacterium]|nr:hypothetical protein [Clostridia bacterium]